MRRVLESRDLGVPVSLQVLGSGGVVPVAIDDHGLLGMLAGCCALVKPGSTTIRGAMYKL